ncbi:MAG: DNA polymerase IV [Pseudomonadota bacterium]
MLDDTRKIIHIDMDCFYAAVEVRDNPRLKRQPVAVGGKPDQRGVLCTCNYEARKFGLHSAMSTAIALQRCKNLVLLPVNMAKYRQVSQSVHAIFRRYTERIEPLSLDEAYLDVTGNIACQGSASRLARKIRQDIRQEIKLTASAGVAPNKFLAKVASDWRKPDGQYVIPPQAVASFMRSLPVKKIPGVGRVTQEKLHALGFKTCGDLQSCTQAMLVTRFGKFGLRLYHYCRGIDDRAVEVARLRKSVSVETTFVQDLPSLEHCQKELPALFETLARRLEPYKERAIHKQFIKLKFSDLKQSTKECVVLTLSMETFYQLLKQAWAEHGQAIRLLGLGARFAEAHHTEMQMDFLDTRANME